MITIPAIKPEGYTAPRNLLKTRIPTIEEIHREAEAVHYPECDGQPMAESDFQRGPLTYAVEALSLYFKDQDDVYVSGNILIYYEEGNPQAVVSPDVFAVQGVSNQKRRVYKVWEENRTPDFVIEITSKSTRSNDKGEARIVCLSRRARVLSL